MNIIKAKKDLERSYKNLKDSVFLFHQGSFHQYGNIAFELRKLLCDVSERDFLKGKIGNSLLPKLVDEIKLPPIGENSSDFSKDTNELTKEEISEFSIYMPGLVETTQQGAKIIQLFQENVELLNIHNWLNQYVFIVNDEKTTIYELIRSTTDKEIVHSDDEYDEKLNSSQHFVIQNIDSHMIYIVAIGELIIKYIENNYTIKPEDNLKFHEPRGNLTGTYTFKGFMPKTNYTVIQSE